MKNRCLTGVILALLVLFSSCGKEQLTPLHNPKTVNQLRNDQPLFFSYKIDDTQIDEYAKNAGNFPIFGKLFQAIAVVLANSTINNQGGHELELGSIDVDLSTISSIDFSYLKWIKLNNLKIEIRNSKSKDNLRFINKIEIYAKLKNVPVGIPVDENGFARILYYDNKEQSLGCEDKCLNLMQENINWKQLIQENKMISVHPKIVINSVPLSSMKLAGSVDFSIKFDVGF